MISVEFHVDVVPHMYISRHETMCCVLVCSPNTLLFAIIYYLIHAGGKEAQHHHRLVPQHSDDISAQLDPRKEVRFYLLAIR